MATAIPHGAGASQELPRLLFLLPRGLTSSGTSRLLPTLCLVFRKTGGNARNKLLIWLEMFLVGEREQQGSGEACVFPGAWRFKFVKHAGCPDKISIVWAVSSVPGSPGSPPGSPPFSPVLPKCKIKSSRPFFGDQSKWLPLLLTSMLLATNILKSPWRLGVSFLALSAGENGKNRGERDLQRMGWRFFIVTNLDEWLPRRGNN